MRERLEVPDRPVELLALLGVLQRLVERGLGHPDVCAAHEHPLEVEPGEHDLPTAVQGTHQVLPGHDHVVQEHLVGAEDVPGQRRRPTDLHACGRRIDQHQGQPLVLGRGRVGAHVHRDGRTGQARPGAPCLLPVEDEVVAVVDRGGAQCRDVGAGVRLAHGDGEALGAIQHAGQVAVALGLGAPLQQGEPGDEGARVAHRDVEAGTPEFLGEQHEFERGTAAPTAVLR